MDNQFLCSQFQRETDASANLHLAFATISLHNPGGYKYIPLTIGLISPLKIRVQRLEKLEVFIFVQNPVSNYLLKSPYI